MLEDERTCERGCEESGRWKRCSAYYHNLIVNLLEKYSFQSYKKDFKKKYIYSDMPIKGQHIFVYLCMHKACKWAYKDENEPHLLISKYSVLFIYI